MPFNGILFGSVTNGGAPVRAADEGADEDVERSCRVGEHFSRDEECPE